MLRPVATIFVSPILLIRRIMAEYLQLPIEVWIPLSIPVQLTVQGNTTIRLSHTARDSEHLNTSDVLVVSARTPADWVPQ